MIDIIMPVHRNFRRHIAKAKRYAYTSKILWHWRLNAEERRRFLDYRREQEFLNSIDR